MGLSVVFALAACTSHPAPPDPAEQARRLRLLYALPPTQWPAPTLDAGVAAKELGPLPAPAFPADNPYSAAKAALGEKLFFDPRLSRSGQIACASCHEPQLGWADGRRYAFGNARSEGVMNTPSIANAAHLRALFWDGRRDSLEQQAGDSLANPIEMDTPPTTAAGTIARIDGYRPLFAAAYDDATIDWPRMRDAIATFVRTVEERDTPFDRFLQGDTSALGDDAVRGLHLFRTRARCMNCHNGPELSDGGYHHLGTSFFHVGNYEGRYRATHVPGDMGRFRTPGLRGVAYTGPWMHNGLIDDLTTLVQLYNNGWWQNTKADPSIDDALFPKLDPLIKPLDLSTADVADLVAFLRALSTRPAYRVPPELPASGASHVNRVAAVQETAKPQPEVRCARRPMPAQRR